MTTPDYTEFAAVAAAANARGIMVSAAGVKEIDRLLADHFADAGKTIATPSGSEAIYAMLGGYQAIFNAIGDAVSLKSESCLGISVERFVQSIMQVAALSSPRGGEDFLAQLRRVNGERYAAWTGDGVEDPLYLSNEFGGEAGEIQNVVKKLVREERGWRGSRATIEQLADEIADGIICLDNLARGYGIDLAAATTRKFNETSDKNGFPHKLTLATEDHRK